MKRYKSWPDPLTNEMWQKVLKVRKKELAKLNSEEETTSKAPDVWTNCQVINETTRNILEQTKKLLMKTENSLEKMIELSKSPEHDEWVSNMRPILNYQIEAYTKLADQIQIDCVEMQNVINKDEHKADLITGPWTSHIRESIVECNPKRYKNHATRGNAWLKERFNV